MYNARIIPRISVMKSKSLLRESEYSIIRYTRAYNQPSIPGARLKATVSLCAEKPITEEDGDNNNDDCSES